jgi:two-component system NtrC family response regulator
LKEGAHILIVDDDRTVCKSLELLLRKNSFTAKSIHHPSEVMEEIEIFNPALILLDMNFTINTSGKQGMKMLDMILDKHQGMSVILMTGWGTLQLAVEGMKKGARDFLTKPWDNKHMLSSIKTALELSEMSANEVSSQELKDASIIGRSPSFLKVLSLVDRVAATNASILITGESGTGKEVIAEAIHNRSKRSEQQFVKVNLGGISTSLFESEMFGHIKGAFTDAAIDRKGRFAVADGGTIFLDEIGDLALPSQVKLLRVLQEKSYEVLGSSKVQRTDVRVISATHKPLEQMVAQETFREDLYYRINLIHIRIPSLSEREEDIPLLVHHFVKRTAELYEFEEPIIEDEAILWLSRQDYPGNIRQLRNLVERTTLLSTDKRVLGIKDFQEHMLAKKHQNRKIVSPEIGKVTLDEMEEHMVRKAYAYHNQSVSKTSRSLGITRSSLYRRLEKYGIN